MKRSPKLAIAIVVVLLVICGGLYFLMVPKTAVSPTVSTSTPAETVKTVTFSCDSGSFQAIFSTASVALTFDDGRTATLPQVMSGSGIRYESTSTPNEDMIFSSEGSNGFITENGKITYNNCLAGSDTASAGTTGANGMKTFTDQGNTFSFMYPSQFSVTGGGVGYSNDWMVNATTSGMVLAKLVIPSSFEPKTNFGNATFTIGTSADPQAIKECTTFAESGGSAPQKSTVTINGVAYTKFLTNDAGAGNEYQTTSYRTIRNSQCYAIEYTIHSSNIENYSPDQGITAFDQSKVQSVLDGIVQSTKFKS